MKPVARSTAIPSPASSRSLQIVCPPAAGAAGWTPMSMAFYFYIVAFGTVAAFCCYLASFRFIPVSAAVLLSSFEPLTAVLFGVVFMGLALSAA